MTLALIDRSATAGRRGKGDRAVGRRIPFSEKRMKRLEGKLILNKTFSHVRYGMKLLEESFFQAKLAESAHVESQNIAHKQHGRYGLLCLCPSPKAVEKICPFVLGHHRIVYLPGLIEARL